MKDLSSKESESDELSGDCRNMEMVVYEEGGEIKKCLDCGASKTPLWRTGPAGPKTLCNACGIRSRKKRFVVTKGGDKEKKSKKTKEMSNEIDADDGEEKKIGDNTPKKMMEMSKEIDCDDDVGRTIGEKTAKKVMGMSNEIDGDEDEENKIGDKIAKKLMESGDGGEVVISTSMARSKKRSVRRRRKKIGEEEQAAFLLMALSCGSVLA